MDHDLEELFTALPTAPLRPWASIWAKADNEDYSYISDHVAESPGEPWTPYSIVAGGEDIRPPHTAAAAVGDGDLGGWLEVFGMGVVVAALGAGLLKLGRFARENRIVAACSALLWTWAIVSLF